MGAVASLGIGLVRQRDDDRRFWMALSHAGVDAVLVVSAIAGVRGDRTGDLIEQGADLRTVVDLHGCKRRSNDLVRLAIQADVQLSPGPTRLGPVLLLQPLARAAQAQARAVHQQVRGFAVAARLRARHLQHLGPAVQGGVVRHAQLEPEQADDGADHALGLAQRQAEQRAQGQPGQNGER